MAPMADRGSESVAAADSAGDEFAAGNEFAPRRGTPFPDNASMPSSNHHSRLVALMPHFAGAHPEACPKPFPALRIMQIRAAPNLAQKCRPNQPR